MALIRLARNDDIDFLAAIEIAAGRLFAEIGMADVAGDGPTTAATHRAGLRRGHLWVAADADDRPVGFALVRPLDGCIYLQEISVHPDHGAQGNGTRLLDAVVAWARSSRQPAVTLSTFRDVAWNGPWYRRYGFRELREDGLTPGLLQVRHGEAKSGLDTSARFFMRFDL